MCGSTYRVHVSEGCSGETTEFFVCVEIGHVLEKQSPRSACILPRVVAMQACPHMPCPFICRHRTLNIRNTYKYGVDSGDDAVLRKDKEETYGRGAVIVASAEHGMARRLARSKALLSP